MWWKWINAFHIVFVFSGWALLYPTFRRHWGSYSVEEVQITSAYCTNPNSNPAIIMGVEVTDTKASHECGNLQWLPVAVPLPVTGQGPSSIFTNSPSKTISCDAIGSEIRVRLKSRTGRPLIISEISVFGTRIEQKAVKKSKLSPVLNLIINDLYN